MEAQLQRPTTHQYKDDDPHNDNNAMHSVIGGEGEREHISPHHGEKKSVLKKVKDKAKKIRETITKHGGHSHEHEYRHDQISEEENDEDDETVNVHGAPPHELAFISGTNLPKQTGLDLEKPPGAPEDRHSPSARNEFAFPHGRGLIPPDDVAGNEASPVGGVAVVTNEPGLVDDVINRNKLNPDIGGDGAVTGIEFGLRRTDNEMNRAHVEHELPTSLPSTATKLEEARAPKIGPLVDLVEDPHSPGNRLPVSNYETKVVDPTGQGGKEAEVAPLIDRLDHLHVGDQSEFESASYTGSHDQFDPQSTPVVETFQDPETMSESFDPENTESMPRDTVTGKISSATSAIRDKAVSAKNVVASKLGYGGQQEGSQEPSGRSASETVTEYGHKVVENLEPTGAGSAITCRGGEDEHGGTVVKDRDKGVSVRDYLAERLSPGEEDKALSEAITDAIHKRKGGMLRTGEEVPKGQVVNAGTGVVDRVKDAVGSWLGMGGETHHPLQPEHGSAVKEEEDSSKQQGSG